MATGKKKATSKKRASKKKTAAKKAVKKKAAKRTAMKRTRASAQKTAGKRAALGASAAARLVKGPQTVEPGPPSGTVPPVEEPVRHEEAIGVVTHYYSHLGVAVVQVNKDELRTGDTAHVLGHSTDFTQTIESMEYEHEHIDRAGAGQSVGIKVAGHAREHDIVYVIR